MSITDLTGIRFVFIEKPAHWTRREKDKVYSGDQILEDTTIYAHWYKYKRYTIKYQSEFGSITDKSILEPESGEVITEDYLPELSKFGYEFQGWWNEDYTTQHEIGESISEDTIFYAKWYKLPGYIITFNTAGKTNPPAQQLVLEGDLIPKPLDPVSDYYTFLGWYADKDYITIWDFDIDTPTSDMTLYAKWDEILKDVEIDWTQSMQRTYKFYKVDPKTWRDIELIRNTQSCDINWDLETDTLVSASFEFENISVETYVRVYMVVNQNGNTFPDRCLGTFIVQPTSNEFNGKRMIRNVDAYSPLIELKSDNPPIGYTLRKGENIMKYAYLETLNHSHAPILEVKDDIEAYDHFLASADDSWFTFLSTLIEGAKYQFMLDEYGRIIFNPISSINSLQPRWIYTDDNSSIIQPSIKIEQDLYAIPNAVEVIYSSDKATSYARYENHDKSSPISIENRGRVILHRVTDPNIVGLSGEHLDDYIKAYARELLIQMSVLEHRITYTHAYCPVRIGDGIMLDYKDAGLIGVKAKVISQKFSCTPACQVEETAVYYTNLWNGGDDDE